MNFIARFKNGFTLLGNSFAVMRANPRLLLFPAATAVLTVVIGVLFMTPIVLQPSQHAYTTSAHWAEVGSRLIVTGPPDAVDRLKGRDRRVSLSKEALAYFILAYFLSMFLATFFNVAFVHEIFDALDGNSVSVAEGIAFALTKLKPILMWTLFAGVVGLLIKALEQRFGFFGRWVIRLIGTAWSVAAVFVIPILVVEKTTENPLEVMKRSAGVIRAAWGEALGGYAGLQLGGLIVLSSLFLAGAVAGWAAYAMQSLWPVAIGLSSWLVAAIAFSYALGVAGQIYLCVLYRYATAGVVPAGYTPELLGSAWTPKKS
ncbi:MAG: DUF6159 family protein [Elusimicrobiota bacterium]|nr:DUF6159 family protein [Elusimicrobiota bacterium]